MKNITEKYLVHISLFFGFMILLGLATIWSQPLLKSDTVLVNEQPPHRMVIEKGSGLTIDLENLPEGLVLSK